MGRMVYERRLLFLVTGLTMIWPCFAFITERSANSPVTPNTVSSSEIKQPVTSTSGMRAEVTDADKLLQLTDTKSTAEVVEQTSPDAIPERKFIRFLENPENETNSAKIMKDARMNSAKENPMADSVTSGPRNVVLVIAETGQDRDDFWRNFKFSNSFPVEGLLQNCDSVEVNGVPRFSLEGALISGNGEKKCDCEHFLSSNIVALLLWARDAKGMTIASLSNANFTIPSFFGYEETVAMQRKFDEPEENNMKLEIRNVKSEMQNDWRAIDLGKSSHRAIPFAPSINNPEEGADDTMWNVFDMFSKIKLALFRSLLDSFGSSMSSSDDSILSHNLHIHRSALASMIRKLKSIETEKGFVLAVTIPANELKSAVELLQQEVSQETLLVVTGVCPQDNKPMPFFAQGPAANKLHEARLIWDLPTTIGHTIANGCQGAECKLRRHDDLSLPIAQLNNVPHNVAIFRRTYRTAAVKSDKGNNSDAPLHKEHEIKKVADLNSKEEVTNDIDKSSSLKFETRSSSSLMKVETFNLVIGTFISIITAFTLVS